jgi:transcriptional regulator with XRE-family HTH domain
MIGENIKAIRKNKGMTQEELAIKLNVARQTISKWEKGLSVPDAELVQKISEILDVDIKQLLGTEIHVEKGSNELVEQLSRINEQLAFKNQRSRRIYKIVGFVFLIVILIVILLGAWGGIIFNSFSGSDTSETNNNIISTMEE